MTFSLHNPTDEMIEAAINAYEVAHDTSLGADKDEVVLERARLVQAHRSGMTAAIAALAGMTPPVAEIEVPEWVHKIVITNRYNGTWEVEFCELHELPVSYGEGATVIAALQDAAASQDGDS